MFFTMQAAARFSKSSGNSIFPTAEYPVYFTVFAIFGLTG